VDSGEWEKIKQYTAEVAETQRVSRYAVLPALYLNEFQEKGSRE